MNCGCSDAGASAATGSTPPSANWPGARTGRRHAEDEYAWTAGLERIQARERRGGADNLPLRLSVGFHRWSYGIGGQPVDEWTYAAGTGFPFRGDLGQLDVALSYGRIGVVDLNDTRARSGA